MNERPRIIAVDFDGTLCENRWPEIGEPKPGVIAYCRGAKLHGSKLILYTARRGQHLREAVRWCKEHGLTFDAVNKNLPEIIEAFGGDTRKIVADKYIDDKALPAETVEEWYLTAIAVQRAMGTYGGEKND